MIDQKYEVQKFSATLTREPDSSATFVSIPFNVLNTWGTRARVPVKGSINGTAFRGSIVPYGGVHYLGIKRDLREQARVKAGDIVDIVLEVDSDPRIAEPPADLLLALEGQPAAKVRWKRLSYSHQRAYIESIEDTAKSETRARRIEQTLARLMGKKPE